MACRFNARRAFTAVSTPSEGVASAQGVRAGVPRVAGRLAHASLPTPAVIVDLRHPIDLGPAVDLLSTVAGRAAAPAMSDGERRCRRVGHSIIKAGADLEQLAARLEGSAWDMVELDVLGHGEELVVAHSVKDLAHPRPVRFADALAALRALLPAHVEFNVDLKGTGYERAVLDTLHSLGLIERTLISTMEAASLRLLRTQAPELRLGLSVPRARRDYLGNPLTRPAAYVMLAYLRRVLPHRAARAVRDGVADAIMAHWGVVTPALVRAVGEAGGELYVWTVDDARRLVALHALGVSAVITNDRDLFARAGLVSTT